jgi:hypothetical protein
MAGPWERYQNQSAGPWTKFQTAPEASAGPSVAEDIAKSTGSGLARGAVETAMLPVTLPGMARGLLQKGAEVAYGAADAGIRRLIGAEPLSQEEIARREALSAGTSPITSAIEAGQGAVRRVMDENLYRPQTTAGEYARTVGEFIPAAVAFGGGGLMARAASGLRYGVAPGLASEAAGQATEGTDLEPWARGGAALATGIAAGAVGRSRPEQAIARDALRGVDEATIQQAAQLMDDAARQGVTLTWPEAINQVSRGAAPRLAQLQRVVENTGGGAEVMGPVMAQRPQQVQAAGRAALEGLSPGAPDPIRTGAAVQRAAQGSIDDTTAAINQTTRPLYQAAEAVQIDPATFEQIRGIPAFQQGLAAIRNDPILGPQFANMPDNSVAVVDAVQKRIRDMADAAGRSGEGFRQSIIGSQRGQVLEAADAAAPTYSQARQAQAAMREAQLAPLEQGPIGTMAGTADVAAQTRAAFPSRPQAGMAQVTGEAIKQIVRRDPKAGADLVRQHAETIFSEATQNLQSGANQFGGAKFAATLRGNPEQAASLEAAVKALPGGNQRWDGFNRFLDIVEATGQRLQTGSATAFNQEVQDVLRKGGRVGELANVAATGGLKLPEFIRSRYQEWRMGRNTEELARLLTDSRAVGLFARLAKEANSSARAQALAIRLAIIAGNSRQGFERGQPKQIPAPR